MKLSGKEADTSRKEYKNTYFQIIIMDSEFNQVHFTKAFAASLFKKPLDKKKRFDYIKKRADF